MFNDFYPQNLHQISIFSLTYHRPSPETGMMYQKLKSWTLYHSQCVSFFEGTKNLLNYASWFTLKKLNIPARICLTPPWILEHHRSKFYVPVAKLYKFCPLFTNLRITEKEFDQKLPSKYVTYPSLKIKFVFYKSSYKHV